MRKLLTAVLSATLLVGAAACGDNGKAGTSRLLFDVHPQAVYEIGEDMKTFSLALREGDDVKIVSCDDKDVRIVGFDTSTAGEKQMTITYKGYVKTFGYTVLLPEDQRPVEPGEITVYSLKELNDAFAEYSRIDVAADLLLAEGESFTVPRGKQVRITDGFTLTNRGYLFNEGRILGSVKGVFPLKSVVPVGRPNQTDAKDCLFSVSTAEELAWIAYAANHTVYVNGWELDGFTHCTIEITKDIDLFGYEWIPVGTWEYEGNPEYIGDVWTPGAAHTFKGTIEGKGHTIAGLHTSEDGAKDNVGFIGAADYEASVKNLNFTDLYVVGGSRVGAVVGYYNSHSWADGFIENVSVKNAEVVGKNMVGGLIGKSENVIQYFKVNVRNCTFSGNVSCEGNGYSGGLVGYASGGLLLSGNTVSAVLKGAEARAGTALGVREAYSGLGGSAGRKESAELSGNNLSRVAREDGKTVGEIYEDI